MTDDPRESLKQSMRSEFDLHIEPRIDRYHAVKHQWIVGDHHFAHASHECLLLYRDGYFTSCIMVAQAVSEGIVKFVADRCGFQQRERESKLELAERLHQAGIVSESLVDAFCRIQRSYRNDFHHMNPTVATVDVKALAERNVMNLAAIEREVFECALGAAGTLVPRNSKFWDLQPDGSVPVYIRRD